MGEKLQYIIRVVRPRARWIAAGLLACVAASAACGRALRQYEYEEDVTLDLDGSATVVVNASLASLYALRGLDFGLDPRGRVDRAKIREAYESPVARVTRVSRPWRRHGRRFVQVRLEVDDIRALPRAAPFAWSEYRLDLRGDLYWFRQTVGPPPSVPAATLARIGWTGGELVAFRLHLPSVVEYHNVRHLETDAPGEVERGNILRWEQRLSDRLNGVTLEMEARMQTESNLSRTVGLFALAFAAAVAVITGLIWLAVRRDARRERAEAGASRSSSGMKRPS
jgi:hypothetical protein